LAAPYLWMRRPKEPRRQAIVDEVTTVAWDAATFAGMVRGTLRTGTVVL
jgi:hypothetical protein